MIDYYSDRELGQEPKVKETIDMVVWRRILSLIEIKIGNGSLAYGFPSHCPDGNAIEGTASQAMTDAIRAEIGDLTDNEHDWKPSRDHVPKTPAILDLIEFVARHIAQPTSIGWHEYFKHNHLKLDREVGLQNFVEEINRLFSRNGLAYELNNMGIVERTIPTPMIEKLRCTTFRSGDQELDDLLNAAVKRFVLPKPETRQDALEKLWDAFERLKTIEGAGNKKTSVKRLIDKAAAGCGAVFRSKIEHEFETLTMIGNKLRIRHSEIGKEPVENDGEKEYLFMRLFSLIWFVLSGTDRLSGGQNDRHGENEDDEEIPF